MEQLRFIPRDTSWLSFNHRVLQEAKDPSVPLYERIKFLAIYSSNLDEFFRVRVAAMRQFKLLNKADRKEWLQVKPKKELRRIREVVHQQQTEFGSIFRHQILPALRRESIFLLDHLGEYTPEQRAFAKNIFAERLQKDLTFQYIEPDQEPPFLKNRGLYMLITFTDTERLGLVNIPSDTHDRFWLLPAPEGKHAIGFLDDIIRAGLPDHYDQTVDQTYSIKMSRDAELYLGDEYSGDLVEKIRSSLDRRDEGAPARFLYDSSMPVTLTKQLKVCFHLKKNDLFPGGRYHNFHDFFGLPDPSGKDHLHNPSMPPLPHPVLENKSSLIQALKERDHVLHFPYQQYDYVPRFIEEASRDEAVKYIKITLYRVAGKSAVVEALLEAKAAGKEVTAFIEAKARFDEASNLYWGKELEKAGAHVFYSYPEIKVHTKLLLVGREEEGQIQHYAYLGTGNFNEKTARLYGDHALLTSDSRLSDEVDKIFGVLEKKLVIPKTKHLLVSPFTTRDRFEDLIDREIELAREGKDAYMILKMNSLEDKGMIEKLYEASQAGVRIRMIVRGICCLVPGVPGLSEHISITSIVDRFLEHARIYVFGNDGKEKMYTASADWMERNLDRRIEAVMPIYDKEVYQELRDILTLQLRDNTKARQLNAAQSNPYQPKVPHEPSVRAQIAIYRYLKDKLSTKEADTTASDTANSPN